MIDLVVLGGRFSTSSGKRVVIVLCGFLPVLPPVFTFSIFVIVALQLTTLDFEIPCLLNSHLFVP